MKKLCKYCKSPEHTIDTCPEILCKICNQRGHPHWKCKSKDIIEKEIQEINIKNSMITKPIINKLRDCSNVKSLSDYMNIIDVPWGELKF